MEFNEVEKIMSSDDIAAKTGFVELTEALTTAVLRAVEARDAQSPMKDPRFPNGTITLGLVYDPGRGNQEASSSRARIAELARFPDGLIKAGEGELSEEAVLRVNKKLSSSPKVSSEFAASFFANYPRAMAMLFDLDEEQKESIQIDACENRQLLQSISKATSAILETGEDIVIDFRLTDEARADAKRKWCVQSFTITATGSGQSGSSGSSGGGTVGGSVTFGRCKK